MDELTLKIDCCNYFDKELDEYLSSLSGIYEVNLDYSLCVVYLKYDSNIISIQIIKKEILLFLSLLNTPSIIAFDKHSKNNVIKHAITIKDLCCEYCLKGMIEDLLSINGIEKVFTDFDYNKKDDVKIYIEYDNTRVNDDMILNIEKEFNI